MADSHINGYRLGKVTRPLDPGDLSEAEKEIIKEIEAHIKSARDPDTPDGCNSQDEHFAQPQVLDRRVMLLDGGRGTGKTSILQTLVRRWNTSNGTKYDEALGPCPDFIRVLPILDFDPLPPGMPLAAGIIQAWRPLVDHCEGKFRTARQESEADDETLLDRWHKLFRVAAVGWTSIPQGTGLIEQVLDREEQVSDWQRLDRQWSTFVDRVIEAPEQIPSFTRPWPKKPAFIIMIDDLDLQVARARELLPALRLLYHPSVFFIVAAHRDHLIDMLKLDFLGKQREVARHSSVVEHSLWEEADTDVWANVLARAAFQKAFAKPYLFQLKQLSLTEWLNFPGKPFTFKNILDDIKIPPGFALASGSASEVNSLGDYIAYFAKLREEQEPGATRFTPYRMAQQLADVIFTAKNLHAEKNAMELLCRLLDHKESETSSVLLAGDPPMVEFRGVGEVTALYSPEFIAEVYPGLQEIVLSGRPKFKFRAEENLKDTRQYNAQNSEELRETVTLLAISLRDSHLRVEAPGLTWEAPLALAWTRWTMKDRGIGAAFRWPLHQLPSPLQLYEWTASWARFIKGLAKESKDRRDRMAYAWIYYQLRWLGGLPAKTKIEPPEAANLDQEEVWKRLLKQEPPKDTDSSLGADRWRRRTLPLFARPEIGLTPRVQGHLLEAASKQQSKKGLLDERGRLVRDAFDAASAAAGKGKSTIGSREEERLVEEVLVEVEHAYPQSPWNEFIDHLQEP
jgi:hypothetical protein